MAVMELKKGDKVILKGFTGIKLGVFEVTAASKKTLTITKANGEELVFDRKTCKQINVEEGKERYANSIMEDDGSYVKPNPHKGKKKAAAKAKKAEDQEDAEAEDEEDDEEEVKPAKKSSKKPAKKVAKKPAKEELEDDEDDDEEYEEIDE